MIVALSASQSRAAEFNEGPQHGLQVEGRAADHLEHVGSGCLLLPQFAQISRARLHFIEQTHVLDRDRGLIGESFDKSDLLIRKGSELPDDRSS